QFFSTFRHIEGENGIFEDNLTIIRNQEKLFVGTTNDSVKMANEIADFSADNVQKIQSLIDDKITRRQFRQTMKILEKMAQRAYNECERVKKKYDDILKVLKDIRDEYGTILAEYRSGSKRKNLKIKMEKVLCLLVSIGFSKRSDASSLEQFKHRASSILVDLDLTDDDIKQIRRDMTNIVDRLEQCVDVVAEFEYFWSKWRTCFKYLEDHMTIVESVLCEPTDPDDQLIQLGDVEGKPILNSWKKAHDVFRKYADEIGRWLVKVYHIE